MARLIKDEPIANGIAIYVAENAYLNDTALDVLKMVAEWVNEAPTVDAVEVVHGRWKYYHKQNKAVCTNCSFERDLDANFGRAVSCPNCGASMRDGDGNGQID